MGVSGAAGLGQNIRQTTGLLSRWCLLHTTANGSRGSWLLDRCWGQQGGRHLLVRCVRGTRRTGSIREGWRNRTP